MSHRTKLWRKITVSLFFLFMLVACKKQQQTGDMSDPPVPPSDFEVLTNTHATTFCPTPDISDLKIKTGENVGLVYVGNDSDFLYLTYSLSDDWYLTSVQSYAGQNVEIPTNPNGNPDFSEFPAKQILNPCDQTQTLTFRVPLSSLKSDNSSQCSSGARYFVAMRATVKQKDSSTACQSGNDLVAWAAPVLINPGNADEWATAFYYCRQDNTNTPWCAYGQGYWFAKPNVSWCQSGVSFGNLSVSKDDARALWPAMNNDVKKAFFQATALQLSMMCNNNGSPIPESIAADYNAVSSFLAGLGYEDIKNGTVPSGTDMTAIKTATGNIGKFICQNNCNSADDPTVCQ